MNSIWEPAPCWLILPGDPPELRRELALLRVASEPTPSKKNTKEVQ